MLSQEWKYTTHLGALERFKNDLVYRLRKRVFDAFMREFRPGAEARVADFGVSTHRYHPVHYYFETLYPHKDRLTALGREGSYWYEEVFPGLKYVNCDLRSIPFPDDYFDFGLCSDVIEHAGSRAEQRALVEEVCRTCRNVLFTAPNRSFPIETHTFVPFLHWLPGREFRLLLQACGLRTFASEAMLNPLDGTTLLSLFPRNRENTLLRVTRPLPIKLICVSRMTTGGPPRRNPHASGEAQGISLKENFNLQGSQ